MGRVAREASTQLRSFGELLKKHRLAAGLSREELADRARLSVKTISALEQGARQKPYRDTILALADALNLSAEVRTELERAALPRTSGGGAVITLLLNMPSVVTPLVDRHDEINSILDLLARYRLVTVTGSGGVGKTRVAVALAKRYAEIKMSEAAFVDLSPLESGSFVAGAIVDALGLTLSDTCDVGALTRSLRDRTLLLILDNCEHLVADVANVAHAILHACPSVVILATSRERLDVPGEALFRLPSLSFPDETSPAASVDSYSAIKLFAERAKALDPQLGVSDENVNVIADICRRLEGIPLAIELAAARLPALGLAALRARLDERFILAAPARGVPSRHATMRATIAWSCSLLDEAERTLLNRLAIFVGGFTLEAAEHVCAGDLLQPDDVNHVLAALVDKSLVNVSLNEKPRYRMLDSVRAYASEQLALEGDRDALARRHASWLADVANTSRRGFGYKLEDVLPELGNLRAALQWALESAREEDIVTAGRIVGGLRRLWIAIGSREEYRFWSASLINRIDEARYPEITAQLWGGLAQVSDDTPEFEETVNRAFSLCERIGDYSGMMHLRNQLAYVCCCQGNHTQAESALTEAMRIGVTHHLERSAAYVHSLGELANVRVQQGRPEEARACVVEAFTLPPANDAPWRPWLMHILSEVELGMGNAAKALEIVEEAHQQFPGPGTAGGKYRLSACHLLLNHLDTAIELSRDVVSDRSETREARYAIVILAAAAALRGGAVAAARLLGFVEHWRMEKQLERGVFTQRTYEILIDALRARLSDAEIEQLKGQGRSLSFDQAVDEAFQLTACRT